MDGRMDRWMDGRMDGRTYGWMDGWMVGRTDGWTGGWIDLWMDGRMNGRMNGQMDEWKDGRMNGWMDGWTDGRLYFSSRKTVFSTGCDAFAHSKAFIILYIKYVCRYIKTSCVRLWSRALVWICFSSCKLFSLSSFSCRLTSSTFTSAASWLAFRVFILYKTTNTAAAIDMTTSRAHNKWDTDVDANEVRLKVELRKLQSTLVRKQIFNIIK